MRYNHPGLRRINHLLPLLLFVLFYSVCARRLPDDDILDDGSLSRWKRPFFNPYPSWLSFIKQRYNERIGGLDEEHLKKRLLRVSPSLFSAVEDGG